MYWYLISFTSYCKDNKIGKSGAKKLSEALRENTTLTELHIFGNIKEIQ